ncbi:LacI family DNA-binding transcriptional regulator [Cellulosimicrobium marinum]|uniref:LacI family DNA-binding transcriptional regulator n=1 Tax=Cellulosimicrobium marinum TaxID=1638992 RepID=UPI001E351D21|nr:LacI family DNA-binding transcriptional regulator [Cellulosimicrobium marinum]MCB7135291.1 LacI family transcriptional regulator [Cellulosimicrobium marinum]
MAGPTLSDVAREAGVSLATASRAINGSATRTVRADLHQRVLEAAERLRYTPDPSAQAMARGRTTTVGLVVHDIADPYFSSLAAGVADAAEQEGLIVTLTSTQHRPDRETAFVELMDRQRARVVVLGGGRLGDDDAALLAALERYREGGGRVALVGQPLGTLPVVEVANRQGAADLATALHGLGHRSFGVLAGPPGHRTARDRVAGCTEALAALGSPVDPRAVVPCAFTRDGGYAGMRALLDAGTPRPRVVLAVNDVMAVGAMAAARDAGLRVPDDVAVAGFDDIVTLRDVVPGLTTVRIPLVTLGRVALRLALGLPPGDDLPPGVTVAGPSATPGATGAGPSATPGATGTSGRDRGTDRVEVRGDVVLRDSTRLPA